MHSVEELGTNVSAFLAKLWKMVEDPETNDLICWSPGGTSFYIRNQARFSRELLPLYYKHNNMASFVRQLNMYGFHKVVSIEGGGLKIDRDEMEFAHQCFLMGHPYLLEHIKRKIPTNKAEEALTGTKPELVNKVLSEVKSLKGRQDSVDSQLTAMKRENEVLWREVAILRQKHLKQQQIVNKLIHFLVSMVQTSRGSGIGIKRHYPLMLNDITHRPKAPKHNGNITDMNSLTNDLSPTGPVIHEIDPADLLDDCNTNIDAAASSPEFLASDLCSAVDTNTEVADKLADGNVVHPTAAESDTTTLNVNGSILSEANPEVLLNLAECPEMLLVAPDSVSSFVATAKSKGKQKTSLLKGKRRKSRSASLNSRTNPLIAIKTEQEDAEELVNVNNFLEVMMPSLIDGTMENHEDSDHVNETDAGDITISGTSAASPSNIIENTIELPVLQMHTEDSIDKDKQNSLDAATNAAISAISNVAAAAAAAAAAECNTSNSAKEVEKPKANSGSQRGSEGISSKDLTLACAGPNLDAFKCKEDLDAHLDTMHAELESLKEMLKGGSYNLDSNMLLGVCAAGLGLDTLKLFADDSLSFGLPIIEETEKTNKENGVSDPMVSGSELMAYSSNLMDLPDITAFEDWEPGETEFQTDSNEVNTPQVVMVNSPSFSGSSSFKKRKK